MISFQKKKILQQQQQQQRLYEEQKIKFKEEVEKHNNNTRIINSYKMLNIPFQLKQKYNSIIPLHLYTCWHTKDLPPLMKENYDFLVESNPKITFHLYDEEECINFIKENFEQDVLNAYNNLIPCSYKSDLWRFCVLYINGGIYMDIKYRCVNGFKFIALTEEEHFVRDMGEKDTYTALIVTLPQNEVMRKCIYQIVENVKNKFYGDWCLDPTGPGLLGTYFTSEERKNLEMYHEKSVVEGKLNEFYIVKNDRIILKFYSGYRDEQAKFQKNNHYGVLWGEKNIYRNICSELTHEVKVIVARYNEDLSWTLEEPFNKFQYIVYNKGLNDNFEKTNVAKIINVNNVGKNDHTYLYHIIENYNSLTDVTIFFPGSINIDYKKAKAKRILYKIIESNYQNAYFFGDKHASVKESFKDFKLDNWQTTDIKNLNLNSETQLKLCSLRPYKVWYKYFFGNTIAKWSTLWGIFSIDKRDIIQHPIERYQMLISTVNDHSNPEAGHYIERSWGAIFYPLVYTLKQEE